MKRILFALTGALAASSAIGQLPQAWFPTPCVENYDTMPAGSYAGFPAMFVGGTPFATANTISGAPLDVGSFGFLPPFNGLQCMFGNQTDVDWRFIIPMRRFGGYWRAASTATTGMQIRYTLPSGTVWFTSPVLPINTTSWTWYGHFLFALCNKAEVLGVPFGGFVGHDGTRARWW
ncbi:MAG TPA: hypothetical protein PLH94_01615 [Fimbriimonadaceae bacterium]|nr:hypothetical protein [Fimbriimonadaceae bacterium]